MRQVCREWKQIIETDESLRPHRIVADTEFLLTNPMITEFKIDSSLKINENIANLNLITRRNIENKLECSSSRILSLFNRNIIDKLDDSELKSIEFSLNLRVYLNLNDSAYLSCQKIYKPVSLDASRMKTETFTSDRLMQMFFLPDVAVHLREISLCCSHANDRILELIFKSCSNLEILNLKGTEIKGRHLKLINELNLPLECLNLQICNQIRVNYLVDFLEGSSKLEHLYMGKVSEDILKPILRNNLNLTTLHVALNDECCLFLGKHGGDLFAGLGSLKELNIQSSFCSKDGQVIDRIVATVLNACTRLEVLNVNFCVQLTDAAFTLKPVRCFLSELQACGTKITRSMFERMAKETNNTRFSLKKLNVSMCRKLRRKDVLWIVDTFRNVNTIEIRLKSYASVASWFEYILSVNERYFNLYGFSNRLDEISVYFNDKKTRLDFYSVAYMNFRAHFKQMSSEFNEIHV
jgi:hypothetical protein